MFDTADFTLTAYTANDGENLAVYDWPLAEGSAQRGTVLLVHGLGEHAGRYHAVAQHLNAWGFAVRAYDQYGHGQSGGPRGGLNHDMRLLDDLADMVDRTRAAMPPIQPLLLLGHSMGGALVADFVADLEQLVRETALAHARALLGDEGGRGPQQLFDRCKLDNHYRELFLQLTLLGRHERVRRFGFAPEGWRTNVRPVLDDVIGDANPVSTESVATTVRSAPSMSRARVRPLLTPARDRGCSATLHHTVTATA